MQRFFPGNPTGNPVPIHKIKGFPPEAWDPFKYNELAFVKGPVRVLPYQKMVLNPEKRARKAIMLKYWGAVGDFYYFLTFANYVLKKYSTRKIVLAADTYSRYQGHPIVELCQHNGLIDELWLHRRKTGGPNTFPSEFYAQAELDSPNVMLFHVGIYYPQCLVGPGVKEWPLRQMRQACEKERFLIHILSEKELRRMYPQLPEKYVTFHPRTFGKNYKNEVPMTAINAVAHLQIPIVVLQFQGENHAKLFEEIPNVHVFHINDTPTSIWVQYYAQFHVGLESSPLLAAVIHKVHAYYFPFSGISMFKRDLGIEPYCHELDWDATAEDLHKTFKTALKRRIIPRV